MQSNTPLAQRHDLRAAMDSYSGAAASSAERSAKFAAFAEAMDDGLCRLAAVAIASQAVASVKFKCVGGHARVGGR